MTRVLATRLAVLLLASGLAAQAPRPARGVVDALVAVVNGEPLFASQVRAAAWYARFSARLAGGMGHRRPSRLTAAERAQALRHLEAETLLRQARANEGFAPAAPARLAAEAGAQWRRWEQQAGGAAALARLLAGCHLDRATALAIVERQLSLVAYLDEHFSGDPPPGAAAIQRYYAATFVPAARARGLQPAPLAAVRANIAAVLRQQQLATGEQALLARLRAQAAVEARQPW